MPVDHDELYPIVKRVIREERWRLWRIRFQAFGLGALGGIIANMAMRAF